MARRSARPRATTEDERPYLKMQELAARTGLPKSTILHYSNAGLLPAPLKTEANMAYYHPDSVERLGLIKRLQTEHRLSLAAIRSLLAQQREGIDPGLLIELRTAIFGPTGQPTLDLAGFCAATGLSRREAAAELAAGVVAPLRPGRFDPDDVAIGRLRKAALRAGIKAEEVAYYAKLARRMVAREMALRERVVAGLPPNENTTVTLEMTRAAQAMRAYALNRAFQLEIMRRRREARGRRQAKGKESES
jgi:DNA-binding transcriptional MerR regulator